MWRKDGFPGEKQINIPDSVLNEEVRRKIFLQSLYITHIGFFPQARYHFRERENGCNDYILLYSVQGNGFIENREGVVKLMPNQFIVIPPNRFHRYHADLADPWSIYWVHFSSNRLEELSAEFNLEKCFVPTDLFYNEQVTELWHQMYMSLASGFTGPNIRFANMCLYRFLCFFLFPNRSFKVEEEAGPLERSILYMKSNIDKKLTADDIASYIQYSPSHFTARFKQKTGMAPIDYFIKMKIQYACQLLAQNEIKIKDVAGKIGYDDPYYFSRLFKKVTGKSPRHYRVVRSSATRS